MADLKRETTIAYRNPVRRARRPPERRPAAEVDPARVAALRGQMSSELIPTPLGPLPVQAVDDQIRVYLPFQVDVERLTRYLREEGYPVAHAPEDAREEALDEFILTSQGWGQGYDTEGYYPYWVFPDPEQPGRSIFAFAPRPEDVVRREAHGHAAERAAVGAMSRSMLAHWLPVLQMCMARADSPAAGLRPWAPLPSGPLRTQTDGERPTV